MFVVVACFLLFTSVSAFRNPFLQRYNTTSKVLTTDKEQQQTPLEILLKEKTQKKLELYSLYGLDVSPVDRIMDDVIDANDIIHIHGSEMITLAIYVFIVFTNVNNKNFNKIKRATKKSKSKSKRLSIPVIVLGVLINFTRNIKPVL